MEASSRSITPMHLSTHSRLKIVRNGGFRGSIDSFCPDSLYRQLAASFPEPSLFQDSSGYRKVKFGNGSPVFPAFLRANPYWKELWDTFNSEAFFEDIRALCLPDLLDVRGSQIEKPWKTNY